MREARFVNRITIRHAPLFEQLLTRDGSTETASMARRQIEFTHAAVAAMSPATWPDAAFGVEAAARQFQLDFIRLLTEDYFFVCRRAFLDTEPMQHVLSVMKGSEFHRKCQPSRLCRDRIPHGQYREGISGQRERRSDLDRR